MTTYFAKDEAELIEALDAAIGGDAITLTTANGDYGSIDLFDGQYFDSAVTVHSLNAEAPARFLEGKPNGAANLTFLHVVFDYRFDVSHVNNAGNPGRDCFKFTSCDNIILDHVHVSGDLVEGTGQSIDGRGWGFGLKVEDCDGVIVKHCLIDTFWKGCFIGQSSDVALVGNEITNIRSDGIGLGRVHDVLIEGNWLHDFLGLIGGGDHRDFIQVQRGNHDQPKSTNLTIRRNILDEGTGDYCQSIFVGTPGGGAAAQVWSDNPAVDKFFHDNIVIEENAIFASHTQGIAVVQANNVSIQNNLLVRVPRNYSVKTGGNTEPKIFVDPNGVNWTVTGNISHGNTAIKYAPDGAGEWSVENNFLIPQDRSSNEVYWPDLFHIHAHHKADGFNQYSALAGGPLDQPNLGPDFMRAFPFDYAEWVGVVEASTPIPIGPDPEPNPTPEPDPVEPDPTPEPEPEPEVKVVYASNGGAVGDGWRMTKVSEGGTKFEIMVDEKTGRLSEIKLV